METKNQSSAVFQAVPDHSCNETAETGEGMQGDFQAKAPVNEEIGQGNEGCSCEKDTAQTGHESADMPPGAGTEAAGATDTTGQEAPGRTAETGWQSTGFYQGPQYQPHPGQYQQMDPYAYAAWHQQMAYAQAVQSAAMGPQAQGPASQQFYSHPGDPHGSPHHLKHDEHKYGQMIQMAQRFLNGEADMNDIINGVAMLESEGNQFWKGLAAGSLLALLLSSDFVKESLGNIFKTKGEDEKK